MSMTCSHCDGVVEWKGPLSALTHTECLRCGAINAHVPDEREDDAEADQLRELVETNAAEFVARTRLAIDNTLKAHTTAVVEFAIEMQNRVRRAEAVADALSEALAGKPYYFEVSSNRVTFGNAEHLLKALVTYRNHKKG